MQRAVLWLWTLALCGAVTWAQSTQPGDRPGSWSQTVHTLAAGLTEDTESESLAAVLPATTAVRRFDRIDPEDRLSLRETTIGAAIVAALGYHSTPTNLAGDLGDCLREAEFVPEAIRDEFIIEAEKPLKHANETAAQWISTALQPGVEQPIGVIVLWQERAPHNASEQPMGQLVFVLFKAQELAPTQYRISQVIYGDTRQIIR